MNLQNVEFIRSAVKPGDFIRDGLPQVVFAGRSNVGKSSVINCLLNRKNFARVGDRPGKTIHINFFKLDGKAYLVDLPGYGYAQVSKAERDRWGKLMEDYFASGLVTMCQWFHRAGCPLLVVANKTDKCKKSELEENLARIRQTLELTEADVLLPFSAVKRSGREALAAEMTKRL